MIGNRHSINRTLDLGDCGKHISLVCYSISVRRNDFGTRFPVVAIESIYVDFCGHLINVKPMLTDVKLDDIKCDIYESTDFREAFNGTA